MSLEEALERVRCDYLDLSMVASAGLFDSAIEKVRKSSVVIMVEYQVVSEYPEETYRNIVDQVNLQMPVLIRKAGAENAKEVMVIFVSLLDLLVSLSKMGDRMGFY